jgi:hypothetical protein
MAEAPRKTVLKPTGVVAQPVAPAIAVKAPDPTFFRVRGRVPAAFAAQHAIAPDDAIAFTPDPSDLRAFERLRAAGVIQQTGDRFWLDLLRYHADEEARRRRTWPLALGGAVLIAILALFFYPRA